MAESLLSSMLSFILDKETDLIKGINSLHLVCEKSVPEWIKLAESPFTWQPTKFSDVKSENVINVAKEKAEFDDLALDKFIWLLALVYEFSHQGEFEEAEEMLYNARSLFSEEDGFGFTHATKHILLATHIHVLLMKGFISESIKESKELEPYCEMSPPEQAAVQALKAKFFYLYYKKGFQLAVECSKKALELNPEEPMWMFLVAESLRRETKYFPTNELPREELELLEKAVEISRSPNYMVHLALRYNTCATKAYYQNFTYSNFKNSDLQKQIGKMWAEATKLCKEALEMEPNSEVINRRCAHALMKARHDIQIQNKEFIKTAFEKALELYPDNTMTLHYFGKYYETLESDLKNAEDCYHKAAQDYRNLPAQHDLIKLKFKMNSTDEYDPLEDLEMTLQKHGQVESSSKLKVMTHILSYYLFIKRDLKKAHEYFEIILEDGENYYFVKNHHILFLEKLKIDLYKHMANEIMLSNEEQFPNKNQIIDKVRSISSESVDLQPDKFLVSKITAQIRRSNAQAKKNTIYRRHNNVEVSSSGSTSWRTGQMQNQTRQGLSGSSDWRQIESESSINSNWRM